MANSVEARHLWTRIKSNKSYESQIYEQSSSDMKPFLKQNNLEFIFEINSEN